MVICGYSDLDEASCDHCRRGGKPARRPSTPQTGRWVEARYPGQCRSCGEPYSAGAQITPGENGGWVAECCAEEDAA